MRLDVSGIAHLFGGEPTLATDMEASFAALGLSARIAIAPTAAAAWALARFGPRLVEPERLADALASLPVAALRLDARPVQILERLGVPATFYVCPGWWGGTHPLVSGDAARLLTEAGARRLVDPGMELGPPRVSVAALTDLNQLLIERGSRRCSRGGSNIAQEEHHGEPAQTGTAIHDTSPAEHGAGLRDAAGDERSRARRGCGTAGRSPDGGRRPRCGEA